MTTRVQRARSHQPGTSSRLGATPILANLPTTPQLQPADEPEVYWGDKVTLKVWVFCFLVTWMMNIFDFFAGIWSR